MKAKQHKVSRTLTHAAILLLLTISCGIVHAGNPWLTGRTTGEQTVPVNVLKDVPQEEIQSDYEAMASEVAFAASPDGGLIDLVVSVHTNKAGDNKGNVQGGAANAEQDKIERIIQYFADGVYEMSEGAHRLRNVRIYQKGERASQADVVWSLTGGTPHVPARGGVGEAGGKINMYDVGVWYDSRGRVSSTYDFLANEEAAGYCLAHEWGHYFYGMYDEYKIDATDVVVDKSIMNRQWSAVGGNYDWLNFSVAYTTNAPNGPWINTKKTAHHRELNASAWEVLARNPTNDPTTRVRFDLGKRIYYPEVAAMAPQGTNAPAINLPNVAAREKLNIIWGGSNTVIVVVLDRSGSMSGGPLENAKSATKHLLDIIPQGDSVGIISFDSYVAVNAPIQTIASDADRASLKAVVDTISLGGTTAIGDAAARALTEITSYMGASNATPAVILMSDGSSNAGRDPLSVIPDYQNAQIPIMGFGYGNYVDPDLATMALQTGGKYYSSPTDYTTIARAFQDAIGYVSGSASVASGTSSVGPGGKVKPLAVRFPIDSTIKSFSLTLTYDGSAADADLELVGPGLKKSVAPTSVTESGGQTLWLFEVEDPKAGQWQAKGKVSSGLEVKYLVSALESEATYGLRAEILNGNSVSSPSPATIVAHLSRGLPINGAKVYATVTSPDGLVSKLAMKNTSAGEYTATYLAYTQNGAYDVDIKAENVGLARLTYKGAMMSPAPDGSPAAAPRDKIIKEKFSRSGSLQLNVSNIAYTPTGGTAVWNPVFRWPGDPDALSYTLKLYRNGRRVLTKVRKDSYYESKSLPLGNYEWQVGTRKKVLHKYTKSGKPVYKKVTYWSGSHYFTRTELLPGQITKISPEGLQDAGQVAIQWQADRYAQKYVITIERLGKTGTYKRYLRYNFRPKTPDADRFVIRKMKPGSYRWFIQAVGYDGAGPEDLSAMEFVVQ